MYNAFEVDYIIGSNVSENAEVPDERDMFGVLYEYDHNSNQL